MGRFSVSFRSYKNANAFNKRMRKQGFYVDGYRQRNGKIRVVCTPYRGKGSSPLTRSYVSGRRSL